MRVPIILSLGLVALYVLAAVVGRAPIAEAQAGQASAPLVSVSLRADGTGAALPVETADELKAEIYRVNAGTPAVSLAAGEGGFEVVRFARRLGAILGPEGVVRKTFPLTEDGGFPEATGAAQVAGVLRSFALQERIANLAGKGTFSSMIGIRTVPVAGAGNCRGIPWAGGTWGELQAIPLCQQFTVDVRLASGIKGEYTLHLFVLSNNGGIVRFRAVEPLAAGETLTEFVSAATGDPLALRATPPVNIVDKLVVVAVPADVIVDWRLVLSSAQIEDAAYANAVTFDIVRSIAEGISPSQDWAAAAIDLRTIASDTDVTKRKTGTGDVSVREYTVNGFDITPYLPADTNSSLFKVLAQAEWLAIHSQKDGVPYKQHDWPGGADPVNDNYNLATGIDCSRSIWFAFTRAGLPYNRSDRYLATADMVTSKTWMRDEFESCETPYRTGDVLVYRDDKRGVGHTVMVIDPEQRIAWGSHGWDGNGKLMKIAPDTGVEYQLIKVKKDWERWDSANMTLRSCWRYKRFAEEWSENPASRAGSTQAKTCENMCSVPQ
jgi:hypothetical protein